MLFLFSAEYSDYETITGDGEITAAAKVIKNFRRDIITLRGIH